MEEIPQVFSSEWLTVFNLAGLVIYGLLYWQRGGNRVTKDIMDLYEKNVQVLKERIESQDQEILREREAKHDMNDQLQKVILDLALLKKDLADKEKKLEEYKLFMTNRNPELEKVLAEIRDFMKVIHRDFLNKKK